MRPRRRLTPQDLQCHRRRREDLREWGELTVRLAASVALAAILLCLAGLSVYEAVANGRWLPVTLLGSGAGGLLVWRGDVWGER